MAWLNINNTSALQYYLVHEPEGLVGTILGE